MNKVLSCARDSSKATLPLNSGSAIGKAAVAADFRLFALTAAGGRIGEFLQKVKHKK